MLSIVVCLPQSRLASFFLQERQLWAGGHQVIPALHSFSMGRCHSISTVLMSKPGQVHKLGLGFRDSSQMSNKGLNWRFLGRFYRESSTWVETTYAFFKLLQFQISDERCAPKGTQQPRKSEGGIGPGAIFGICIVLVLVISIGAWCVYAYRYPTSKSGLFLIEVSLG